MATKKEKPIKLIFNYLKDEKLRLVIYMILVIMTYVPALLTTFFWGYAIEGLINQDYNKFLIFLIFRESTDIMFYALLAFPRDYLYKYLEIKATFPKFHFILVDEVLFKI